MLLPCMKNDIIVIIIIIITIIINVTKVVGSGRSRICIYINTYFPTCAQCSKVVRCQQTVQKQSCQLQRMQIDS